MSISYPKDVQVVFMVKEGSESPREATEEDFLKAGFVRSFDAPNSEKSEEDVTDEGATCTGFGLSEAQIISDVLSDVVKTAKFVGEEAKRHVPSVVLNFADKVSTKITETVEQIANEIKEQTASVASESEKESENSDKDECPSGCEDCSFLIENNVMVDSAFSELFGDVFKDIKVVRLDDVVEVLLDPFKFVEEDNIETEKPVTKEKVSPVEDFTGDLFNGAFSLFNTVKNGLSGLLDPIDGHEPSKPSPEATPESTKTDEPVAEEKPEFTEFEQTIIGKFEEMGLGADAKSAMRKSKEFTEFLATQKPTPEQAKAFAEMLKNGKPPFFG